jgi:hypothetical protein
VRVILDLKALQLGPVHAGEQERPAGDERRSERLQRSSMDQQVLVSVPIHVSGCSETGTEVPGASGARDAPQRRACGTGVQGDEAVVVPCRAVVLLADGDLRHAVAVHVAQ